MPIKTYLLNKINARKCRLNGILPSTRLPRKHNLRQSFRDHLLYSPEELPPKADLRDYMVPVEDQSRIGSCSANALAGAYEYLTKKHTGQNTDVSRLFIYYNARVKQDKSASVTDSGASMTDTIEALEEFGTCLESIWPYDISKVNTRPNDQAYQAAQSHKITQALQINIDLHEMKSCIAQGFPFVFGLRLFTSFDKAAKSGVVPMPSTDDQNRQSDGSHALLAVGYSDQSQAFIVRNSWGASWGDKGYCYIPYDYMTNSDLCFDIWTVRKVAQDDFGQEHWDNNDEIDYQYVNNDGDDDDDDSRAIQDFEEDDDEWNNYGSRGGFGGDSYNRNNDFDFQRRDDRWNSGQNDNGYPPQYGGDQFGSGGYQPQYGGDQFGGGGYQPQYGGGQFGSGGYQPQYGGYGGDQFGGGGFQPQYGGDQFGGGGYQPQYGGDQFGSGGYQQQRQQGEYSNEGGEHHRHHQRHRHHHHHQED